VFSVRKDNPNVSPQRRAAEATLGRLKQTLETEAGRGYVTIDHFLNARGDPSQRGGGGVIMPSTEPASGFYNVGDIVAMGGMGAIIRATDRNLERTVAMKIMLNSANASESSIYHFIAEAKITGQLEHPNIVPLHDMGVAADGTIYYTMKLIEGTTLREILQKIRDGDQEMALRYPLDRLLEVFQKVCDGMAYAHSRRVVHRDLKPDNIMVGAFGEVLILDWGIAKVLRDTPGEEDGGPAQEGIGEMPATGAEQFATMQGQIKGTPNYMAPEQAEGRVSDIDERTDIYAMGGILYTILTLYPPIVGTTVQEILAKVTSGDITAPTVFNQTQTGGKAKAKAGKPEAPLPLLDLIHLPDKKIPSALSAVAMKAMALDKDSRYQDLFELQGEIRKYLGGYATSAEDAGVFTQLKLALARYKKEIGIAALFLAIAAGIGVYAIGQVILAGQRAKKAQGEAEKQLAELRATAPTFFEAAKNAIDDYQLTNALDKIETALKFNPTNAEYHYVKGQVYQSQEKMVAAQAAFRRAKELSETANPALAAKAENNRQLSSRMSGRKLTQEDYGALYAEFLNQKRTREANEMRQRAGSMDAAGFEALRAQIVRTGLKGEWLTRDPVNGNLHLNAAGANSTDISGIRGIQFTTITFAGCARLENIGAIDVTKLESLDLSGTRVTDLSPIRGAPKLSSLNLANTLVVDLLPLDKVPLTDLNLSNCVAVADISRLKDAKLARLNLWKTQVRDLSALKDQPVALLNIERSRVQQSDLDSLKGNETLTTLFAAETSVRSIAGLINSPIEFLDLRGSLVTDLGPLTNKAIHTLLLDRCRNVKDLKPLTGMRSLKVVALGNTDVTDLGPLQGLPLSVLRLSNTRVTDLSPLLGMPLEQELDLSFTAVADISALRGISVQILNLQKTRVKDIEPLGGLAAKTIRLDECDDVVNLLPLGKNAALERLSIPQRLNAVTVEKVKLWENITAVRQLPNLKSLTFTVPGDDWNRATTRDAFWKEFDTRWGTGK
jgi:serine/threonine protein kinase